MERWVLFVEDDANFREVFTRLLREALAPEQLDVAFVEAGSAAEARARLREGGLDAALIDITLPDGNGLDLVGEINDGGLGRRIPTLVLAATLETSVAVRAVEAGARGALSKQVSVPETVDAINRLIDAGRPVAQARPQTDGAASPASSLLPCEFEGDRKAEALMTKVWALLGVVAVLVLVGSAAGCGLVSDQTKQEAKKKVESKAKQAEQKAKQKVEASQEDLQK
jgi:CheY-like chemotaxis protein